MKGLPYLCLLLVSFANQSIARGKYHYDIDLGGVPSVYTLPLIAAVKRWPLMEIDFSKIPVGTVGLQCFNTPGNEYFVGVQQTMWVDTPRSEVQKVLENVEGYPGIFPGYEDVHVVSRDENRLVTFWEQIIPVFFIPNLKYQMLYVIDEIENRVVYRYQLETKISSLNSSDGMIVIEQVGQKTRYVELDFFDVSTSIISSSRIWRESAGDIFLSDMGIKLKSEHPEWTGKQVKDEAKEVLAKNPIDKCLESKTVF